MKYLSLNLWLNAGHPVGHGYTPRTEEDLATLRIGPIVIGWEVVEE